MRAPLLRSPAFIVSAAVLLTGAVALNAAVSGLKLHLRKKPIEVDLKVQSIAMETRGWKQLGHDQPMPKEIVDELGTSNYLSRYYERKEPTADGKRPVLELHLAYYTGMVDTVPHVPERCMVGGGWNIKSSLGEIRLPLDTSGWRRDPEAGTDQRPVYLARLSNGQHRRMARGVENATILVTEFEQPGKTDSYYSGYFFIANGGVCASAEAVRVLAFDLTSEYAFYLKVQVSGVNLGSADKLAAYGADLLNDLLPDIMLCVPDWVEVERGNYPPGAAAKSAARGDARGG